MKLFKNFSKKKKIEELVDEVCSGRTFSKNRLEEIKEGLKNGLSVEKVRVYANYDFTSNQMREIRTGFENLLNMDQVMIYAKPEFGSARMANIRIGLETGYSTWQIELLTDQRFHDEQATEIAAGLQIGLTKEQMAVYTKPEFTSEQMHVIFLGFQISLSLDQVLLYAKPEMKLFCMVMAWEGFKAGLSVEQVAVYANEKFNKEQMEEIREGFFSGLTLEEVSLYADDRFTVARMIEVREGFEQGLDMEQVKSYGHAENHHENMRREKIRLLANNGLCSPILKFYLAGGKDQKGRTLEKIWEMNSVSLERSHDYIQWLFPTNEKSGHNGSAPVLTESEICVLQKNAYGKKNMIRSLELLLEFYGLEMCKDSTNGPKIYAAPDKDDFKKCSKRWLTKNNHNYLRITRILKSLRLFGLDEYAAAFYNCLKKIASEVDVISEETLKHWEAAMR